MKGEPTMTTATDLAALPLPALLRHVRGERLKGTMASELEVSAAAYGRWERGRDPVPFERLPWLAQQSGVPLPTLESRWTLDYAARSVERRTYDAADARSSPLAALVAQQSQVIAQQAEMLRLLGGLDAALTRLDDRVAQLER